MFVGDVIAASEPPAGGGGHDVEPHGEESGVRGAGAHRAAGRGAGEGALRGL